MTRRSLFSLVPTAFAVAKSGDTAKVRLPVENPAHSPGVVAESVILTGRLGFPTEAQFKMVRHTNPWIGQRVEIFLEPYIVTEFSTSSRSPLIKVRAKALDAWLNDVTIGDIRRIEVKSRPDIARIFRECKALGVC